MPSKAIASEPKVERRPMLQWLQRYANAIFWIIVAVEEAKNETLEAAWYGVWDSVLSYVMHRTLIEEGETITPHPQPNLRESDWPEQAMIDDDNNLNTERHVARSHALEDPTDQLMSLSLTSSSVLANDNESAVFSNAAGSISTVSSSPHRNRERTRIPDWALVLKWVPNIHESQQYVLDGGAIRTMDLPYTRCLALVEVKRLPQFNRLTVDGETYMKKVKKILDDDIRQQVYQQVRFAFAEYQKQNVIVHISAVGDYCRIRWFKRDAMSERNLIPRNPFNENKTPDWEEMTNSTRRSDPYRIMSDEGKDIHPTIKWTFTTIRRLLIKEIKEEHVQFMQGQQNQ